MYSETITRKYCKSVTLGLTSPSRSTLESICSKRLSKIPSEVVSASFFTAVVVLVILYQVLLSIIPVIGRLNTL